MAKYAGDIAKLRDYLQSNHDLVQASLSEHMVPAVSLAAEFGLRAADVRTILRYAGFSLKRGGNHLPPGAVTLYIKDNLDELRSRVDRREHGIQTEIAEKFGVTRSRVQQVFSQYGLKRLAAHKIARAWCAQCGRMLPKSREESHTVCRYCEIKERSSILAACCVCGGDFRLEGRAASRYKLNRLRMERASFCSLCFQDRSLMVRIAKRIAAQRRAAVSGAAAQGV